MVLLPSHDTLTGLPEAIGTVKTSETASTLSGSDSPGVSIPRLTLWLALVAGLAELSVLEFWQHVLRIPSDRSRQIVWMTPLSYIILLGIASTAFGLAAHLWPRVATKRLRVFAIAFLAAFGPTFLFYPKIAKLAVFILAAGIGTQITRFATAESAGFARLIRRSTPWLVGVVLLATATLNSWEFVRGRQARAAIGAAQPGAPNILLLVLDTVRAWNLSVSGYARPTTPELERFARQAVRFDRAIATAPWTLPSHATMFTGRYPRELWADWEEPRLDPTPPTLAGVLRANGYVTGGFVANFGVTSYESGLDRGFVTYRDYRVSWAALLIYSSLGRYFAMSPDVRRLVGYYDWLDRKGAPEVNAEVLHWLNREKNRPFFAFVNYFDAHLPYLPPAPYDTIFGARRPPPRLRYWMNGADIVDKSALTPGEAQIELNAYDGALRFLDGQVGALLDSLRSRRLLENTIVVVTSDHGEQFGEHGLYDHGNSLYLPLLHVPLLIAWAGHTPRDTNVAQPVSLRDLPATLIDLAGLSGAPSLPGTSLARFWDRRRFADTTSTSPLWSLVRPAPRPGGHYPTAEGELRSLVWGDYHFIRNGDGAEELYDIARDPKETMNLALTARGDSVLPIMRNRLGSPGSRAAP